MLHGIQVALDAVADARRGRLHGIAGKVSVTGGRLLGHARVGTTAKYAHLVHDAEKAAAAWTGDSIGSGLVATP
ncbi:MAG: hypothetical protein J4G15_16585 [Alphaproteobacteria bacterium]|nr:hypothetical protein [Alphaproteobacteria bacterium]